MKVCDTPFFKIPSILPSPPFLWEKSRPILYKGGEAYKGRGLKTMITHEQIMSNEIPSVGFR